jgi:hypothetical protein
MRISISGGVAKERVSLLRWFHYQSNLCGHSCSLRSLVRLYLTTFLTSDITFITRVNGCTFVKQFQIFKSLYNINVWKWLVIFSCISRQFKILGKYNISCLHAHSKSG